MVPARLPSSWWAITKFQGLEAPTLTDFPITDSAAPDATRGNGNQRYETTGGLDAYELNGNGGGLRSSFWHLQLEPCS